MFNSLIKEFNSVSVIDLFNFLVKVSILELSIGDIVDCKFFIILSTLILTAIGLLL